MFNPQVAAVIPIPLNFISQLIKLDDETQNFQSMHPRLQVMMKPVDMAFFTAEHDDHHLATVREILSTL